MNHEPSASFVLSAPDDHPPPLLERVDVDGRVDGILFTTTLRQTWRHAGNRPLEVVYTFPLPPQALLLSFAAIRGDVRIEGTIAPRAEAEAVYEAALERGDAPALLEVGSDGLHTASLGNLMPGETVVLELRFTQLLRFEHSRLRLVVPTTIAPRYGQPSAAGLAPHQAPVSSLTAEYPLSLGVTIAGSLAAARIECPTHRYRVARSEGTTRVELEPGARMDRDVVFVLWPSEPRPGLLVTSRDPLSERPRHVAVAAFELPRRPANRPLSLKLLVDCSGSMAGDSIASAREALRTIADHLGADDEVALVRFGNEAQVALQPARCTAGTLHVLRQQIDATDANLGGTEMASALHATLNLQHTLEQADVLLITDGQIWHAQAVADAARRSGQRVFAIGVGSAAADGVLREIAAASGGACDFATPGEDLKTVALRMLERMRDTPYHGLSVSWGQLAAWQQPLPERAFGGDTVVALAAFDRGEPEGAALSHDVATDRLIAAASESVDAEVLARLVADHERHLQGRRQAAATSVRYRLLTEHTHCVLVHVRDATHRPTESADLVRVAQMLAAGWGGTGSVVDAMRFRAPRSATLFEAVAPARESGGIQFSRRLPRDVEARFSESPSRQIPARATELAAVLPQGRWRRALLQSASGREVPPYVAELLRDLRELGLDEVMTWVVIAQAVLAAEASPATLPEWARDEFEALDAPTRTRALQVADEAVARHAAGSKLTSRARRLLEALRR